ncbi:MAG: thiamine phosphate synthase [Fuerstia sp.]|nr:thiamine phosphate synthase [Fuerstiella sp.]
MRESLTPAARRTVASCRRMATGSSAPQTWCDFLMLALLQDESLASAAMERLGISADLLLTSRHSPQSLEQAVAHLRSDAECITDDCSPTAKPVAEVDDPLEFVQILDRATLLARREPNATGVSSAHLLLAVFETNELLRQKFIADGVDRDKIVAELKLETTDAGPALPIDFDLHWSASGTTSMPQCDDIDTPVSESDAVWRILDANLNRSREGLRVLEDYARFVRNDASLSERLKCLRHDLVATEASLPKSKTHSRESESGDAISADVLRHRDTAHDVGTQISTAAELIRHDMSDVVVANCRRVQEALRSLEEFGKLIAPEFAGKVKQIRYRTYTLQQQLSDFTDAVQSSLHNASRAQKLQNAVLYVLITESACRLPWQEVVEATLRGGADVLQLREKNLNDRELLRRARWMVDACRSAGCLFIVNDRADVAVAATADGVHVGQDELAIPDARAVLRPDQILGISTHTLQQAQASVIGGADYIGVGPTFPTATKSFSEFPGLALVTEVARNVTIPAFAIGGIGLENVEAVRQAGGARVAVSSCVVGSDNPESTVRELKRQLNGPALL